MQPSYFAGLALLVPQAHSSRRLRCNVTFNRIQILNACEPCAAAEPCCVLHVVDHSGAELESLAMPPSHMCASGSIVPDSRSYTTFTSHSLSTLATEHLYACRAVSRGCLHFHPGLWMGLGRLYEVEGSAQVAFSQSAAYHFTACSQSWRILTERFRSSSISSRRQQQGSCHRLVVSRSISCYLARNVAHAAISFDRFPLCCRPACQE